MTYAYDTTRDNEQMRLLTRAVDAFAVLRAGGASGRRSYEPV
jgi:hypothetical protein